MHRVDIIIAIAGSLFILGLIGSIIAIPVLTGSTNTQRIEQAMEMADECAELYKADKVTEARLLCAKAYDIASARLKGDSAQLRALEQLNRTVQDNKESLP